MGPIPTRSHGQVRYASSRRTSHKILLVSISMKRGISLLKGSRNLGAKITTEERNKSLRELQIYREWMTKHFLTPDSEDSGVGSTIIIIPQGSTVPDYRDEMTEGMNARFGPDPNSWGAWLGIPQLVLPGMMITCAVRFMIDADSTLSGQLPLPIKNHWSHGESAYVCVSARNQRCV